MLKTIVLILTIVIAFLFMSYTQKEQLEQQFLTLENPEYQSNALPYKLYKLDQGKGAKCLDGTAPAFYVAEGSPDNFMLAFEGGAWCYGTTLDSTLQDCLSRSKGSLGSSTDYPEFINLYGLMSRDQAQNKFFYNYTIIFIKYCDGTGHQGYATDPIDVQGEQIWMRGHLNTIQILQYALNILGMKKAKRVVVTGFSAGGLATYEWVDFIHQSIGSVNPNTEVLAVPDGFFLDFQNKNGVMNYRSKFQNFQHFSNKEIDPPNTNCVAFYKPNNETWKCMFAEYLLPFIKTPLFHVISEYDSWSIPNIIEIDCIKSGTLSSCTPEEMSLINQYRIKITTTLQNATSRNPNWNAWSPACVDHTYASYSAYNSPNYEVPQKSSWTLETAVGSWLSKHATQTHIDTVKWPGNIPCSHL